MSDHAYLADVGEALYGPRWQNELARNLGVADRTVRRWVAGDAPIPGGVWAELSALITEKEITLRGLRTNMPRPRPTV